MTLIQRLMFETLGGYAGVADLVGARVYPDVAPQGVARPFLVWQEVTLQQANDMSGSVQSGGLDNYLIQVTSWAEGSGERGATKARELDAQGRLAMIAATGFKSLMRDSRSLGYEQDTKLYGHQTDYSVWLKT